MTHEYHISGMTCEGCATTVRKALLSVQGIIAATVNLERQQAAITMEEHIPLNKLREALNGTHYSIDETMPLHSIPRAAIEKSSTLKTYLPIVLIFGYITAVTLLIEFQHAAFDAAEWMRYFMAGFFLTFSFFKMLDIPAFATSYSSYDLIARRWAGYGYIYPFLELTLGIIFLIPSAHAIGNLATIVVMGVSIVGVLQAVLSKRKIQCACLGAVFNLPMSTVTIIEDALMIVMAIMGLIVH